MKIVSRVCTLAISFALLTACASDPRVQSNYDDNLDYSHYQTYNFSSRMEIEDPDLSGTLELFFSAAVAQRMLLRGLVMSDSPEILINVLVDVEDVSAPPVKGTNCPRYSDYHSRRSADPYAGEGRRPMCVYTEGSVKIEMVDVELNRTIWEGVSRVRLDEGDRDARLLQFVIDDVAMMFGDSQARTLAHSHRRNPIHPYNPNKAKR